MGYLFISILALLVATVSCHMTVFRNGMWQSVPGRGSDMDRSGMFGPMNDGGFGFGFPGQMQPSWTGNNMWWNNGFPQMQSGDLNNQWMNSFNGNQQMAQTDPWAQWTMLQNSANQGTNPNANINPLFANNNPSIQTGWNSWASQSGNQGLGLNGGNQFPQIPNNNLVGNPSSVASSNMIGSQWNSQFQGVPNNGMQGFGNPGVANNGMQGFGNNGVPNNGMQGFGNTGVPNNGMQGFGNTGIPNNGIQGFANNGMAFANDVNSIGKKK